MRKLSLREVKGFVLGHTARKGKDNRTFQVLAVARRSLLGPAGSRVAAHGFSSSGTAALLLRGLWALISQSGDRTRVPALEGGFLTTDWTTKEIPTTILLITLLPGKHRPFTQGEANL